MQLRPEAAYLYDAVWIYARAADAVIRQGGNPYNGKLIFQHMKGSTYQSKTAFLIELRGFWPRRLRYLELPQTPGAK